MKLKKLLIASVVALTALLVVFGATACSSSEHEHSFSNWETVTEPTCTAFGLQKRVCECGQTEYDTKDALAHTLVTDAAVDATCTAPGKTEGSHCELCGTVIVAQTETAKISHSFSEWETVAETTCTAFGLEKRVCECGQTEYNVENAFVHTPVTDAAIAATCTAPGKTEGSHCASCGAVIVAQTETEKLAHAFSEWETVTDSTCTSVGLLSRACECGLTEYGVLAMLAHTPVTDAAIAATCTSLGKTEGSHCNACGIVIEVQETILPIGHNCDSVAVIDEAFCNHDGVKRYSCTNVGCDYSYEEIYSIPELSGEEILASASSYVGTLLVPVHYGNYVKQTPAFVIREDGVIVTSNYKIDNCSSAIFYLGGIEYDVTAILAYSESANLAVLKVDATGLPVAPLCTSGPVDGETVYSVGAPAGATNSIARGIISNAHRIYAGSSCIQHDADMSAGYCGGPLINRYGEVIGLNTGYYGEDDISLAVNIAELASLDYSNPISFEEYGAITYAPVEQIRDWVQWLYNATATNIQAYVIQNRNADYALGYHTGDGYIFIEGTFRMEGYTFVVRIIFDNEGGTYQYNAVFTDGMNKNEVVGFIDAESFTESTILTYDSFYGRYWNEDELMALYSGAVYDTLGAFSYLLEAYFLNLSLDSFGFTSLSYDRDEEALDKLNSFLTLAGTPNEDGAYELNMSSQAGSDPVYFNLTYTPATDTTPSVTEASIIYYSASGTIHHVQITLNPTDYGNRFFGAYYDGTDIIPQSTGYGYLDAGTLTPMTKLTFDVIEGLVEYEDGLLLDYAFYLSYLMDWLNYIMVNVSPELSIADLGFFFYV